MRPPHEYRWALLKPTVFSDYSDLLQFSLLTFSAPKYLGNSNMLYRIQIVGRSLMWQVERSEVSDFYLFRYKTVAQRKLEELKKLKCML